MSCFAWWILFFSSVKRGRLLFRTRIAIYSWWSPIKQKIFSIFSEFQHLLELIILNSSRFSWSPATLAKPTQYNRSQPGYKSSTIKQLKPNLSTSLALSQAKASGGAICFTLPDFTHRTNFTFFTYQCIVNFKLVLESFLAVRGIGIAWIISRGFSSMTFLKKCLATLLRGRANLQQPQQLQQLCRLPGHHQRNFAQRNPGFELLSRKI